jgi:hypothetical protein
MLKPAGSIAECESASISCLGSGGTAGNATPCSTRKREAGVEMVGAVSIVVLKLIRYVEESPSDAGKKGVQRAMTRAVPISMRVPSAPRVAFASSP